MKTLSKLKLHALKDESNSVLSKNQMKELRGGQAYVYCNSSGYSIRAYVDSCSGYAIAQACGSASSGWCEQR